LMVKQTCYDNRCLRRFCYYIAAFEFICSDPVMPPL